MYDNEALHDMTYLLEFSGRQYPIDQHCFTSMYVCNARKATTAAVKPNLLLIG